MPPIVILAAVGSVAATALLTWALWRMNKPAQNPAARVSDLPIFAADVGGSTRAKSSDNGDGDSGGGDGGD